MEIILLTLLNTAEHYLLLVSLETPYSWGVIVYKTAATPPFFQGSGLFRFKQKEYSWEEGVKSTSEGCGLWPSLAL